MKILTSIEKLNGRLIYGIAMLGAAFSLTVLPNNLTTTGVIGFIETFWGIQRLPLAAVFLISGLFVFFRRPAGILYVLATSPMLFYIAATFFYVFHTPTNMTVFFFYLALYVRILMDVSKP
jgi:hypothetical protein